MAIPYTDTPLLQKVQLGGNTYYLKDAEGRSNLETLIGSHNLAALSDAAWRAIESQATIQDNANLVTGAQVKSYVDSAISDQSFDVVVLAAGQDLPTASADTYRKIYMKPDSNPEAGTYIEWITIRSGSQGSYTYTWEQIGSTALDLSGYVTDVKLLSHSLMQKKGDGNYATITIFGDLAHKSNGSVTVSDKTIAQMTATGTSAGSIAVTLTDATLATTANLGGKQAYTPAGSITATVDVSGDVTATLNNAGAFQVGGTVAAPTVYVAPSTTNVLGSVTSAGVTPSFTNGTIGTFTAATVNIASATYATSGVTCTIGTGADAETLIFTDAGTATGTVVSNFNGGSWVPGTFNAGSMPSFGSATVVTDVSATASQPAFTGNKYDLSFSKSGIQLKNATFTGTEIPSLIPTTVEYYKQVVDVAAFTPAAINVTVPTFTVPGQTVNVSFT